MDTEHTRIAGGKLDVMNGEIEPTGKVVPLDQWRELAHEHQDCCSQCRYSSWIEAG